MKILLCSDIHGSSYFAQKILNIFEKEKADILAITGDILYHGARNPLPKDYNTLKTAELLNNYKEKIIAVKGNCDSEVDLMVLEFPLYDSAFLFNGKYKIHMTHGHIYNKDNIPTIQKGSILAYGHFHVPLLEEKNGIILLNPGSVSIPKENSNHSYAIIDNDIKIYDIV